MNPTASRYLSLTAFRTRRFVLYAGASVLDHLSWALDLGANACDSLTDRMERVAEGWPGTYPSGSAQSRSFERSGLDRLTPGQRERLEPVARSGLQAEADLRRERARMDRLGDAPPYEEEYGLLPSGSLGVSGDSGARCSTPGEQQ